MSLKQEGAKKDGLDVASENQWEVIRDGFQQGPISSEIQDEVDEICRKTVGNNREGISAAFLDWFDNI
jgi:hypothetical protein